MLLSLESWKKVDMEQRAKELEAEKARGKVEEKGKERPRKNRKIASSRVNVVERL